MDAARLAPALLTSEYTHLPTPLGLSVSHQNVLLAVTAFP